MSNDVTAANYASLISDLLDGGYNRTARVVVQTLVSENKRGKLSKRMDELEAEALRLSEAGERLEPDNPVLKAMLSDFNASNNAVARLVDNAAPDLQTGGVAASEDFIRVTTFNGLTDKELAQYGITFNKVNPAAVDAIVGYVESEPWIEALAQFGPDLETAVEQIAIKGFTSGQSAASMARQLRQVAENLPMSKANNLMRTLQLNAFRDGNAMHQLANADILQPEAIRIAALDGRTCLACISLHGSKIPIGTKPPDHYRGRCTTIATVVGGIAPNIINGSEWLDNVISANQNGRANALERFIYDEQLKRHGASIRAIEDGAANVNDFVSESTDPIFGAVVHEASLKGVLGNDASNYYARGGK